MKVILLRQVQGMGQSGDIVEVSDAQARNQLLPRKMAVPATPAAIQKQQHNVAHNNIQRAKQEQAVADMMEKIQGQVIRLSGKSSPSGKLFAAIKSADIQRQLESQFHVSLPGLRCQPDHLKTIGDHAVTISTDERHQAIATVHIDHGQ